MSLHLVNPVPVLFHPEGTLLTVLVAAFWLALAWVVADVVRARVKRKKREAK